MIVNTTFTNHKLKFYLFVFIIRRSTASALISRYQDSLSASPSSVKGGVVCLDTPNINSPIEDELCLDAYGHRRPRSQSLDSGAPLVPPPLSSALLREELSSGLCNCNCGGNCCCGGSKNKNNCLPQGASVKKFDGETKISYSCCTCSIQPSNIAAPAVYGSINNPTLGGEQFYTQLPSSGISLAHLGPATNSRKMQRNHYHSRKYE